MKLKLLITLTCFVSSLAFSQNMLRSSLGSSGDAIEITVENTNYYISQSVGQSSVIGTFITNGYALRQGFQQPLIKVKSITTVDNTLDVKVYPNPVDRYISIVFNEELRSSIKITINDISGKLIYRNSQEPTSLFNLDMSFIASGIYILKLSSGNKQFVTRLIKK